MDKEIVVALIGAAATIVAALIGRFTWNILALPFMRRQNNIPEFMKTKWEADWFRDDGTLQVRDYVTFSRWTRKYQFEGYGEATYKVQYKYSIVGEASPSRTIALTYKGEGYPEIGANFGMACLQFNGDLTALAGYWAGYTPVTEGGETLYRIVSGRVAMRKVADVKE